MLHNIFKLFVHSSHPWRHIGFDELGKLYVSMSLRSFALGIIGVFVPFYLFGLGYDFQAIALFYMVFFVARTIMDLAAAFMIARIGPKHTIVISYVTQIITSILFAFLDNSAVPYLLAALMWGVSNSLFFVAFHVDFSKIKHSLKGGEEYGLITAVEKFGMAMGPLFGGIAATLFEPRYIFVVAFVLLLISIVPLLKTPEPTKTKQHISFRGMNLRMMKTDMIAYTASCLENNLRAVLWPLYLSLFALGSGVYLKLGALSSLGLLASVAGSFAVGKFIDTHKGKSLLNLSAVGSAIIHLFRPFVSTVPFAFFLNTASEVATIGHQIPLHKGVYDAADDHPGYRITYLSILEFVGSSSKLLVWIMLYVAAPLISLENSLELGFIIAALASLMIMTQKFKALSV